MYGHKMKAAIELLITHTAGDGIPSKKIYAIAKEAGILYSRTP